MKIISLTDLIEIVQGLKKKGKTIVQCHGCFDLIHPGHIKHFEAAKKLGDVLLVTVTPDRFVNKGPGRPVYGEKLRTESIAALEVVDFVALNEWPTAVETIKQLQPDFYVKDKEFEEVAQKNSGEGVFREREAVELLGGKFHLTGELKLSSSRLINDYFGVHSESAESFLKTFREKWDVEKIIKLFDDLKKLKVLVIGDTIIDQYHYVQPMGKTPKANTIAAKYLSEENFAGGVLACANHIAGFCKNVDLLTCLGKKGDSFSEFVKQNLKKNINPIFFSRPDTTTVIKRRFVDQAFVGKLFEIYFYNDESIPVDVEDSVVQIIKQTISGYDLVLVADFGHGFLSPRLIDLICKKSKFLAVNAQSNTGNYGFNLITKYPKADYVCLDEPEVRLACHSKFGDLGELLKQLQKSLRCKRIIVTRGHKDTLALGPDGFREVPVFSGKIVDTVGAGDAFFSITAPCAALDWTAEILAFVGNVVGALAVGIVCNRSSVEPKQLFRFATTLLK